MSLSLVVGTLFDATKTPILNNLQGTLTLDPTGGRNGGKCIKCVNGAVGWQGDVTFETPFLLAGKLAHNDKIRLWIKTSSVSNDTYTYQAGVGLTLHGVTDTWLKFFTDPRALPNTWYLHEYIVDRYDIERLGDRITGFTITSGNPGESVSLEQIEVVHTDGGSRKHLLTGAYTLNGHPHVPPTHFARTKVDSLPIETNSADWTEHLGNFRMDWQAGVDSRGLPISGYIINYYNNSRPGVYYVFPNIVVSDQSYYPPRGVPWGDDWFYEIDNDNHYFSFNTDDQTLIEIQSFLLNASFVGPLTNAPNLDTVPFPYAYSVTTWDLRQFSMLPYRWTSADASGMPVSIYGLHYDDLHGPNPIGHALRFTIPSTAGCMWPAGHLTSGNNVSTDGIHTQARVNTVAAPLGARFRLRFDFDASGMSPLAQKIVQGLKEYGSVCADNGGSHFVQVVGDSRWGPADDAVFLELRAIKGSDMQAVNCDSLMIEPGSFECNVPPAFVPPPPDHAPTGSLTISGDPKLGNTLTLTSTLVDPDGISNIRYKWRKNDVAILNQTATTHVITTTDLGGSITVSATYIDGLGYQRIIYSNAIAVPSGAVPAQTSTGVGVVLYSSPMSGVTIDSLGVAEGGTLVELATGGVNNGPCLEQVSVSAYAYGGGINYSPVKNIDFFTADCLLNVKIKFPVGIAPPTVVFNFGAVVKVVPCTGVGEVFTQYSVPLPLADLTLLHGAIARIIIADWTATTIQIDDIEIVQPGLTLTSSNTPPTGAVVINGVAVVGRTLSADTSTLNDVDGLGTLNYQWLRNSVNIPGATAATYPIMPADLGKKLNVRVSYTDGKGNAEAIFGTETIAITSAPAGTFTSEPLIRQADKSLIANAILPSVTLYDKTSKVLVATFTNVPTNANGVFVLTSDKITPNIAYYVNWVDPDGGHRMPDATAT